MKEKLFTLNAPNGPLRGKIMVIEDTPMVVLLHGHNGFYHFAFFPTLQMYLAENGFSSISFNYSHNGISGDGDYFDELDKYAQNCRRLEIEDSLFLLQNISQLANYQPRHTLILGHSMGGFNAGFVGRRALEAGMDISGIVFLNALQRLDIRTAEVMEEWQKNGVYYRMNGRTNQDLPQGPNFLAETLAAQTTWNLNSVLEALKIPVLVVHAKDDESVPFSHGETIFNLVKENNTKNRFLAIENATHTLNTSHTGNRDSEELQVFLEAFIKWILD